jgi:hypothetical protein
MLANATITVLSCLQQMTRVDAIIADQHAWRKIPPLTLFDVLAYSAKLHGKPDDNVTVLLEMRAVNHEVFFSIVIQTVDTNKI